MARKWLQSGVNNVKQFNEIKNPKTKTNPKGAGRLIESDSYRSIANFLSKNGKAISHVTVKNYIDVTDHLNPKLIPLIHKVGGENVQGCYSSYFKG